MLKRLVNECLVSVRIELEGPVLVKPGMDSVGGPDMSAVRVWRDGGWQVYLPGSSIKGVLRSHAERIARSIGPEGAVVACDPFVQFARDDGSRAPRGTREAFCGACFDERMRRDADSRVRLVDPDSDRTGEANSLNQRLYRESCLICRLFGSTAFAGRLATADAYVDGLDPVLQSRDGVGIDRFTGGTAGPAKFDFEVMTSGAFKTTLHVRNFELYQLGLVGVLLEDLKDGLLRIGSGRSRGLGQIKGTITEVALHYVGRSRPPLGGERVPLLGVGELGGEQMARAYGMERPDREEIERPAGIEESRGPIRSVVTFPGASFSWEPLVKVWVTRAERYEEAEAMRHVRERGTGR